MGEGEGGEKKKYPVGTSIAWYRTLTLFVEVKNYSVLTRSSIL